jgi:hypothetical protein
LLVIDNQQGEAYTFRTTEKGFRFLEIYNRLDDMIKEDEEERVPLLSAPNQIRKEDMAGCFFKSTIRGATR